MGTLAFRAGELSFTLLKICQTRVWTQSRNLNLVFLFAVTVVFSVFGSSLLCSYHSTADPRKAEVRGSHAPCCNESKVLVWSLGAGRPTSLLVEGADCETTGDP